LLSDEELFSLEERFKNDMGFNYVWFLKEVEPKPTDEPLVRDHQYIRKMPNYLYV